MTATPSWSELEHEIVSQMRAAIDLLPDATDNEPIAAIVLWSDPYKGWYEIYVDTVDRNRTGARARNESMARVMAELADEPDAWKTAMTTAARTQALDFDPRYGEFAFADEPIHTFDVSYQEFLDSPEYDALNHGGEDGWLEGHVRFVLTKALAQLVRDGVFASLSKGSPLRVGYAYPDSSDAIIVALVD